jgi:hypothetical protein
MKSPLRSFIPAALLSLAVLAVSGCKHPANDEAIHETAGIIYTIDCRPTKPICYAWSHAGYANSSMTKVDCDEARNLLVNKCK